MISQEQKDVLNEYSEIKLNIKILEEKAKALNEHVLEIMQDKELGEIELSNGKLSIGSRRTWIYSGELKAKEEAIKAEKKLEEQTGKADYTEKQFVTFRSSEE